MWILVLRPASGLTCALVMAIQPIGEGSTWTFMAWPPLQAAPLPAPLRVGTNQGGSTARHGSVLLLVVPAPVLFSCRGSTSSTSQPRWDLSSPLKYRLCGVCPCQRTEQFCASSWADPMQLTLVNHTHVLDRSRNQMSSLCYCLALPMELPHELRKLLFLGWSLLVLLLL